MVLNQTLEHSTTAVRKQGSVRKDIQALRALAVALVVVYHFWPDVLSGGYVGVDVFFVISGFLITTHLIARPPETLKDFGNFWARRIRRLLPLAFIVLAVTTAGIVLFAPLLTWTDSGHQIAASALYIQNWALAADSVNYLAAAGAGTPLQHFWSLSIEEQFYIFWPLFIALLFFIATKIKKFTKNTVAGFGVLALVLVSLTASIVITETSSSGIAYFVSFTRAWELAAGGLIAFVFSQWSVMFADHARWRMVFAWVGVGLIMYSAIFFDSNTAFPGFAALLPVVGSAAVLLADAPDMRGSTTQLGSHHIVQHIGDTSYAIYLWHWPIIIFSQYALGDLFGLPLQLVAIALIFWLASISKTLIEDPFRKKDAFGKKLSGSYIFAAIGMVTISALGWSLTTFVSQAEQEAEASVAAAEEEADECFGANALAEDDCVPHGEELVTPAVFTVNDKADAFFDDCWVTGDFSNPKSCEYGIPAEEADARIALIGNSHAAHWLPAVEEAAKDQNWSVDSFLISGCYTVLSRISYPSDEKMQNCLDWNIQSVNAIAEGDYDAVVISNKTWRSLEGMNREETLEVAQAEYARVLDIWEQAGVPVLVIRDTPAAGSNDLPLCIDANTNDLTQCDGDEDWILPDPLADAAEARGNTDVAQVLDLSDRFCRDETCYSVLGGVMVYFDGDHLSKTFAKTLQEPIEKELEGLID